MICFRYIIVNTQHKDNKYSTTTTTTTTTTNNNNNSNNNKKLQKLDRKMRKLLIIHGHHYPKADIDCLYVPRKQRGRGLMHLEVYATEITKLVE